MLADWESPRPVGRGGCQLESALGTQRAETFVESLQVVVRQREARQRQLLEELQTTAETLGAMKQLMNGSRPELASAIEVATIVPLEEGEAAPLQTDELEEEGAEVSTAEEAEAMEEPDDGTPAMEEPEPSTKRQSNRRKMSTKLGRRPKTTARKSPKTTKASRAAESADPSEETSESSAEPSEGKSNFNPRESVLKEFQGQTIRAAIQTVLERHAGQPFSTNDVLEALYGKRISQENLQVARRLITVELSKGKLAGVWTNVEGQRGHYMAPAA
ncbi:hypothetical protein ACQ4M4_11210 [Leptolyngbya sp. AN02str]|uniref:hypothetical protein n=1 Tax=Leptolyngbya sp. AN02str TaxID=3423363 RepID=UPI003D311EF0